MKRTKRKGFNFFRSYYDVFNELPDKDKLAFITALLDKQFLGVDPTELTGMARFAWVSQSNSIETQVKGYEDKTGEKLTPYLPPTVPPTDGWVNTPTQQVEGKGKGKVQVQVQEKVQDVSARDAQKFDFRKSLNELVLNTDFVDEWLKVRKTKKATNTKTALSSFLNQVDKTNLTVEEVLQICIEHSWSGFKAEWLQNINNTKTNNDERNSKIAQYLQSNH